MKFKSIILTLILSIILCTTGCQRDNSWDYDANIVEFSYSYGGYFEGYYEYQIIVKDEKVSYTAVGYNGVDLNINETIDKSNVEVIEKIIKNNDVGKWNGFNRSNNNVEDGSSFSIKIKYSDGSIIKAHGSNCFPKNYIKVKQEIIRVLENIK